jgi:hypothetical protein
MAVRSTMSSLITLTRRMIADPLSTTMQFQDQEIEDRLDANRNDVRYESLAIAPSIVNLASTSNAASTIFADYYSSFGFWEADVVLQGQGPTGLPWIVLTPLVSELLIDQAHWQFELTPFVNGTVPGQLPPVFATGKIYDVNAAAADLLEFWAAVLTGSYDVTVDGQGLRRSQLMAAKLTMAKYYRHLAKPKSVKMVRRDVMPPMSSRKVRLLDSDDLVKGA